MIKVASYDIWGTLLKMNPEYKKVRARLFARHLGWRGKLDPMVKAILQAYDLSGERFGFASFVERVAESLELGCPDQAALVSLEKDVNEAHFVCPPVLTEAWLPEILDTHKTQGRRVAVISNTGMTPGNLLRKFLGAHGLLQSIDYELYSDEAGVAKPNEAIFVSLIERSNAYASEIVHIGNSVRSDYRGAKFAGMNALLYDPKEQPSSTLITCHEEVFMHPLICRSSSVAEV